MKDVAERTQGATVAESFVERQMAHAIGLDFENNDRLHALLRDLRDGVEMLRVALLTPHEIGEAARASFCEILGRKSEAALALYEQRSRLAPVARTDAAAE